MKVLGLRFSNLDVAVAVVSGSKTNLKLELKSILKIPPDFSEVQRLAWLYDEIGGVLSENEITLICLKRCEAPYLKSAIMDRIENESAIIFAASNAGFKKVYKKTSRTLAKEITGKGVAKNLDGLSFDWIPDFAKLTKPSKEAIFCAVSMFN